MNPIKIILIGLAMTALTTEELDLLKAKDAQAVPVRDIQALRLNWSTL